MNARIISLFRIIPLIDLRTLSCFLSLQFGFVIELIFLVAIYLNFVVEFRMISNFLKISTKRLSLLRISSQRLSHPCLTPSRSCSNIGTLKNGNDDSLDMVNIPISDSNNNFSDIPGIKTGGEKYIIIFTCSICETRSAKKISKNSYHKGVVVVKCSCCSNQHLIADHIGIFEDKGWDIQRFLAVGDGNNKESPITVIDNVYELSPEDILGKGNSILLKNDSNDDTN